MSGMEKSDRPLRVESANSISETAAVRSAFLCLGSPIFERPLCRFLHCGCDEEQSLLTPVIPDVRFLGHERQGLAASRLFTRSQFDPEQMAGPLGSNEG